MNIETRQSVQAKEKEASLLSLLLVSFGIFGMLFGVWQTLLTDLEHSLHFSSGSLGIAISFGLTTSLPVMFIGGQIVDRWGLRTTLIGAISTMSIMFCLLAIVPTYILLLPILVVFYAGSGVYDISINAAAIHYEQRSGRRILTFMHASFSGGVVIGALFSGILTSFGISFRSLYIAVALLLGGLLFFIWREQNLANRKRTLRQQWRWRHIASLLTLSILLLTFISTLASFSEGTLSYFSAIYLRSSLGLSSLLGAIGVVSFNTAMMMGRICAATVIARVGQKSTLVCAGVLAAGGMALALATTLPLIILAGFLLVGLAISVIGPVTFSLGGNVAPEKAGEISSIIAIFGYCGLLVGPSLVGGIAEVAGLRIALGSVIVAGIVIGLLALRTNTSSQRAQADRPEYTERS